MDKNEFRIIPGYENYGVDYVGNVVSFERNILLNEYMLNGYMIVNTFRGSLTETLPVHRAVALAWVINLDPSRFTVVNHIDGNKLNNHYSNLEWTDYSGNNYHAINNGLRIDNIECKIRNFFTKEIIEFSSMSQAAEYMNMRRDSSIYSLKPKMYGRLLSGKYEFKFKWDNTPWFYETRPKLIIPSRYMVTVYEPDGIIKEIYSNRSLLKEYQLYDAPSKSIPALAKFGNIKYPNIKFCVKDSYNEEQYIVKRTGKLSKIKPVIAIKDDILINFDSLTKCAKHFDVDRPSILNRLDNKKDLDGWTFTCLPL